MKYIFRVQVLRAPKYIHIFQVLRAPKYIPMFQVLRAPKYIPIFQVLRAPKYIPMFQVLRAPKYIPIFQVLRAPKDWFLSAYTHGNLFGQELIHSSLLIILYLFYQYQFFIGVNIFICGDGIIFYVLGKGNKKLGIKRKVFYISSKIHIFSLHIQGINP